MTETASYAARRDAVRAVLRRKGLNALLVSLSANRYYLSGFELHNPQENESAGMLLVQVEGPDMLYTDPRYKDMALRLWPEEHLCIYAGTAATIMGASISKHVHGTLGVEARIINLAFYENLTASLASSVDVVHAMGLVEEVRQVKSPDELARMQRSCAVNEAMMQWLPGVLVPGISEKAAAWEIEKFFREMGASELAFPTIVGHAANAALPHCIPRDDLVQKDSLVLVDAGCRLHDYCSDQTRTFWIGGKPSTRFTETLHAVQEAQRRAIEHIRPGIPACDVFQAAWDVFATLGVESLFTHGLGHGVGLETHEAPSLGRTSTTILEPGMVVTVEPGLYDPTWGGIRWEHMAVVTESGCRIL